MQPLQALLDLPDNDLWDIIAGRTEHYDRDSRKPWRAFAPPRRQTYG